MKTDEEIIQEVTAGYEFDNEHLARLRKALALKDAEVEKAIDDLIHKYDKSHKKGKYPKTNKTKGRIEALKRLKQKLGLGK